MKIYRYRKPARWTKTPGKADASKETLREKWGADWNWLFRKKTLTK